jgi:hypothetical protein
MGKPENTETLFCRFGGCCCGRSADPGESGALSRRTFLAGVSTAAAGAALPALQAVPSSGPNSQAHRPPIRVPLRVQPVFHCEIYQREPATSWRVTGAIQDERELHEEEARIRSDLARMAASADFPLGLCPLITVRSVEQATAVATGDFDVLVIYAARRNLPVLEALAAQDKWSLMFVRHQSGPLYYMYIGAHTHFLRKRHDDFGQPNMDARDIVVDDHGELLWRLRALYALKNLRGKRIVAVGGPGGWGADGAEAPQRAQELWKLDIRTVSYPQLGARIQKARQNQTLVDRCRGEAEQYLRQPGVSLETARGFVDRAFLLTEVFRDLLDEAKADATTINACMSTIMPISETTACRHLPLGNDALKAHAVLVKAAEQFGGVVYPPVYFHDGFPQESLVPVLTALFQRLKKTGARVILGVSGHNVQGQIDMIDKALAPVLADKTVAMPGRVCAVCLRPGGEMTVDLGKVEGSLAVRRLNPRPGNTV